MKEIALQDEYITLGQLLKVAGIVQTGGEGKFYLAEEQVLVNGEPENRRGRKLRAGDVVTLGEEGEIQVVGDSPSPDGGRGGDSAKRKEGEG